MPAAASDAAAASAVHPRCGPMRAVRSSAECRLRKCCSLLAWNWYETSCKRCRPQSDLPLCRSGRSRQAAAGSNRGAPCMHVHSGSCGLSQAARCAQEVDSAVIQVQWHTRKHASRSSARLVAPAQRQSGKRRRHWLTNPPFRLYPDYRPAIESSDCCRAAATAFFLSPARQLPSALLRPPYKAGPQRPEMDEQKYNELTPPASRESRTAP